MPRAKHRARARPAPPQKCRALCLLTLYWLSLIFLTMGPFPTGNLFLSLWNFSFPPLADFTLNFCAFFINKKNQVIFFFPPRLTWLYLECLIS